MKYVVIFFTAVLLFSCKSTEENSALKNAESAMLAESTPENVQAFLKEVVLAYENSENSNEKFELLKKGLGVAQEHNMASQVNSFRLGMITVKPGDPESGAILMDMAKEVKKGARSQVADVMFHGIAQSFPELNEQAKAEMSNADINPDTIILYTGQAVFNSEDGGIDRAAAHKYVDLCEGYALSHTTGEASLDYLFKGAEMARSLGSLQKAISLYDMIERRYPGSKKAASALFVKGFIYENNFKDLEMAKNCYTTFLEKYPEDDLADDVQVLIKNLGKSDEELFQSINSSEEK